MATNIDEWIEANKAQFLPPVCNKLMHGDGQLKIMFVGGPNIRADYHMEEGEELFYMVKGDMCVKVIERGQFKDVVIKEGELWILPGRIPHSPQRYENTVGLVIERERIEGKELDGLRWYKRDTEQPEPLYEEWFFCQDLGQQLKPVIERYFASPQHASNTPTTDASETGYILPEPKVDLDMTTRLKEPFALRTFLDGHRATLAEGSDVLVCDEREFKVRAIGGAKDSPLLKVDKGEVWLWQFEGSASVKLDGKDVLLNASDSLLVRNGQSYAMAHAEGCITLEVRMVAPEYAS